MLWTASRELGHCIQISPPHLTVSAFIFIACVSATRNCAFQMLEIIYLLVTCVLPPEYKPQGNKDCICLVPYCLCLTPSRYPEVFINEHILSPYLGGDVHTYLCFYLKLLLRSVSFHVRKLRTSGVKGFSHGHLANNSKTRSWTQDLQARALTTTGLAQHFTWPSAFLYWGYRCSWDLTLPLAQSCRESWGSFRRGGKRLWINTGKSCQNPLVCIIIIAPHIF